MRRNQTIRIGVLVVLVALGAWFWVWRRGAGPTQYEKRVVLPAAAVEKIPPSIHPLIYRFLLGTNPEVQRAAVLPNSSGEPVSLVVYSAATSMPVLREEFKDYLANTHWDLKEIENKDQLSLFAERDPEQVAVILVPNGSGTVVTLSYTGPVPQPQ